MTVLAVLALFSADAQFRGRGRFRGSTDIFDSERLREKEMMEKALNPEFSEDVFTFARLKFDEVDRGYGLGGGRLWDDDTPNADLNLIFRLHDVTSLKVRPGLNFIDITPKDLANYPFVYMAAAGRVILTDENVSALRRYLLSGGFIMFDDFWGDDAWAHFYEQIKRVFPDREPVLLSLAHPVFHSVYDFKQLPQVPSAGVGASGQAYDPYYNYSEKGHDPHYYGIYDDKQRLVALICHNNHYGDGWEHEGDDQTYFYKFSLPMGYPMLLNVLVYAMTH
jgi:hypothetical protein